MIDIIGRLILSFLKVLAFVMIIGVIFPDIPKLNNEDELLILGLGMILFFEAGFK